MKIGIITMISDNYGNRLQNYALQEVLHDLGNSVETLNNPWSEKYNDYLERIKFAIKKVVFYITKKPERFKRKLSFVRFNNDNIHFSQFWLNKKKDKMYANEYYDLFVCGSDQVWNSEAREINGKYFADFADHKKRASYAASFGIECIIEDRKSEFKNYLLGMNHISVREQSGIKIVEALINVTPKYHIDPTLLLSSEKWDKLANKYKKMVNKYIFCYFLGKPSEKILNKLQKYKKINNLTIASIWSKSDGNCNNVGPEEFLSLIKNAEFVLTDSFHGTVFSIIYHKPFYTFSRNGVKESMDTRVISLLDTLNLGERFDPENLNLNAVYEIDFQKADCILNEEKKKAINYLSIITR